MPAGIAQPVTGFWLVWLAGWDPWSPWLVASYGLYVIAFCCWLPVVFLQIEAEKLAAEAARNNAPLPPRYHAVMRWWFTLGWPAFIGLVAVFAFMVAKPQLW